ncbi:hypothetical protein HO133_010002 [Letharia lupina]|uniref:Origin recognition complex subunit 4 n=1 Tax=Letharia lupina TaxID=560253 RepID=A0A8H6FEE2_9LECA|nr:uncharacterized protein HO133_010002 [Letharia lupina]KAF6224808.1 hypothetical protein HO133_010002 [Letharia lupina]
MPSFDPSPRAAKRQKTTSDDSSLLFTSRVLRTVKQAVFRKASGPKINDVFNETKLMESREDTPGTAVKNTGRQKSNGEDALQQQSGGKKAVSTPVIGHMLLEHAKDEIDELDGEVEGTPSRGGRRKVNERSQEQSKTTELSETSTKKKRLKYKGWVEIEEPDELQGETGPGDARDSDNALGADHLDSGKRLSEAVRKATRAIKRAKELEIDMRDQPGTGTPSGRLRRKLGRLSDGDDNAAKAASVTTTSLRRNQGQRKQPLKTATVLEDNKGEVEDPGFGKMPTRKASVDDLAQGHRTDELDHTQPLDTPSRKSRKKRKDPAPAMANGESSLSRISPVSALDGSTKDDGTKVLSDDAKALQKLLQDEPELLTMLQTRILESLTGKRRLPLVNLENEYRKVHQLVEQTVLAGEGNSMLITGSRGSGKTTLVETAISEVASDHRDEFHVVRLNGFIHTDDKLALREIWRQLGREMEVEDDVLGGRSNYADTLASLLALLSHPAQQMEDDDAATARSVVFILDEFDLFASHPRQTLLYNLFDVAQSRNAPIAVLGLTTKVNVVDSLEKRVKSRFGQRYVHLLLPRSFTAFQEICISALYYQPSAQHRLLGSNAALQNLSMAWNAYLAHLFATPQVDQFLQTLYTSSKSVAAFLSASLLPIATMSAVNIPTASSFISHSLQPPDSKLVLFSSLSTLELSLLIAAARLDIILDTDVCTFSMVYEEYVALASKSKLQSSAAGQMAVGGGARVWSKDVSKGAWEHLSSLELVLPAVGAGRGGGRGEMWRVDVGLEEIGVGLEGVDVPGKAGLGKWCKEI